MYIKVVEADPLSLENVFDHLKIRETCDAAVREGLYCLIYVLIGLWHNNKENYGMMTMIFGIMIRLLGGTMIIKNVRHRKHK